jgi:transcriptional regulator with XRE-family HTH domain
MGLRALREAKGVSRLELAKRSGLASVSIWRFETGKRTPTLDSLRKLADALDEPLDVVAEAVVGH